MPLTDVFTEGTDWRKASYSVNNGACAEAASAGGTVMVRDSADPSSPVISYPASAWQHFLAAVKSPA